MRQRASSLESDLAWQLTAEGIRYDTEFKFHAGRRWRFDFIIDYRMVGDEIRRIAVECEGLTSYGNHLGRHQSARGFAADCEKYNTAVALGWRVLRVTAEHIKSGQAIEWIKTLLG
jgi:hypothetical protein